MVNAQIPQATLALTAAVHRDVSPHTQGVPVLNLLPSAPFTPCLLPWAAAILLCLPPALSKKAMQLGSPCSLSCSAFTCNLHMTFPPKSSQGFDLISFCCLIIFHCLDVLQVAYPFIL